MGLRRLDSMFPEAVQKANIERQIDAVRVCAVWGELVRERMAPEVAVHSDALSYDEQSCVLVVGVANASVSCELQYASHVLKKELHTRLGKRNIVERVVFKIVG